MQVKRYGWKGIAFLCLVATVGGEALCGGESNRKVAPPHRVAVSIRQWSDLYRALETALHLPVVGVPHPWRGDIRLSGTREEVLAQAASRTGLTVQMEGGQIAVFGQESRAEGIPDKEIKRWLDQRLYVRLREAKALVAFLNALDDKLRARLASDLFIPFHLLTEQQRRLFAAARLGLPLSECPPEEINAYLQEWQQAQESIVAVVFYPVMYVVGESGESMTETAEPAFPDQWREVGRLPWSEMIKRWRIQWGKIGRGSGDPTASGSWEQRLQEMEATARQIAVQRQEESWRLCDGIGAKTQVRVSQSILSLSDVMQQVRKVSPAEVIPERTLARQVIYVTPGAYASPLLLRAVCRALGLSVRPVGKIFFFTSSSGVSLSPQQKLQLRDMAVKVKAEYWRLHCGFLFPSEALFRHLDPVWSEEVLLQGAFLPWKNLNERQRGFLYQRFPDLAGKDLSRAVVVVAPGMFWYWCGIVGVETDERGQPRISPATGQPILHYRSSGRSSF